MTESVRFSREKGKILIMVKVTKSAVLAAVKSAIAASLASKGSYVPVSLPGWENYELRAHKGYASKVQQYPSTFIHVRNRFTRATAWSMTAGYLSGVIDDCVKRAKQFGGWCGPVANDYIPATHPAYSLKMSPA